MDNDYVGSIEKYTMCVRIYLKHMNAFHFSHKDYFKIFCIFNHLNLYNNISNVLQRHFRERKVDC